MREQTRPLAELEPSVGLAQALAGDDTNDELVTVSSGPYVERLPIGHLTIGAIRTRLRERLDIDPHSVAVLNGQDADDETQVRPGQVLMFIHRAGEKGNHHSLNLG